MKNIYMPVRYIAAGFFILVGIIGLLIPIFPTVPFLVVAALILGKKPKDIIDFYYHIINKIKNSARKFLADKKQK